MSNANVEPSSRSNKRVNGGREQGFSLLEVSVVTAIMMLIAIIAVPAISSYLIENKVTKVGEEFARYIVHNQLNAPLGEAAPYAALDLQSLLTFMQPGSVLSVGGNNRVLHGLGSQGQVLIAPAQGGQAYTLSFDKVHHAACPGLASVLQRLTSHISIAAVGGQSVQVKQPGTDYNGLRAKQACAKGAVNTFVFTVE